MSEEPKKSTAILNALRLQREQKALKAQKLLEATTSFLHMIEEETADVQFPFDHFASQYVSAKLEEDQPFIGRCIAAPVFFA